MNVPESHVVAEGRSLRGAIEAAAEQLGVPASQVEHKLDLAHFRSASGAGVGTETVKIFAWAKDPATSAPLLAAEAWMKTTLAEMERNGSVRADSRNGAVVVHVDVGEDGRHLVGRGGATLQAMQRLMEGALEKDFPGVAFRIDVARPEGEGERYERRDDRGEPRRDDRGEPRRDDRGEGRRDFRGGDRGDRGDRGGRDRDRPRGRDRGGSEEEDLKRLARKIAEKVLSTGETESIRRELNSHERRIVHMEVATISGVKSESVGEGRDRRIEIRPYAGGDEGGEQE